MSNVKFIYVNGELKPIDMDLVMSKLKEKKEAEKTVIAPVLEAKDEDPCDCCFAFDCSDCDHSIFQKDAMVEEATTVKACPDNWNSVIEKFARTIAGIAQPPIGQTIIHEEADEPPCMEELDDAAERIMRAKEVIDNSTGCFNVEIYVELKEHDVYYEQVLALIDDIRKLIPTTPVQQFDLVFLRKTTFMGIFEGTVTSRMITDSLMRHNPILEKAQVKLDKLVEKVVTVPEEFINITLNM